jgi:hypothetical protein
VTLPADAGGVMASHCGDRRKLHGAITDCGAPLPSFATVCPGGRVPRWTPMPMRATTAESVMSPDNNDRARGLCQVNRWSVGVTYPRPLAKLLRADGL